MAKSDGDRWRELVERVAGLKELRDQSAGAEAELLKRLKDEFGIKSVADGRAELKRLEQTLERQKKSAEAEYERIEKELDDAENAGPD